MIPRPTLEQSVKALADRDEYKVILRFIREERERLFGDLQEAMTPHQVMKVTGGIITMDGLLGLLDTDRQ